MAITDRYRVKLRILNEDYVWISPAPPERLECLGRLVDQKMREALAKEPRLSITRAAVMSAMMFADQALTQESRCQELEQEVQRQKAEVSRLQAEMQRSASSSSHNSRKGRR